MVNNIKVYGLLVLIAFAFTACDDEPLPEDFDLDVEAPTVGVEVEENELVGTWTMTNHQFSVAQEGTANVDDQTLPVSQLIEGNYVEGDVTIVFEDTGDYVTSGTATYTLSTTQQGLPSETEEVQETLLPGSGTWSISNGVLTLVDDSGQTQATISSFDGQEMKIVQDEALPGFEDLLDLGGIDFSNIPGFEDFPDITFDIENTFDSEMTFTKSE